MQAAIVGTIVSVGIGLEIGLRPRLRWMIGGAVGAIIIASFQMVLLEHSVGWIAALLTIGGFLAAVAAGSWIVES